MIYEDYHSHTNFSTDSVSTPESMVESAISLGLKRICFTDHMDYLYPSTVKTDFIFDPNEYLNKLSDLKEIYQSKIDILVGIELGLRNEPDIKQIVREYYDTLIKTIKFDFIIGSTHVLENCDPYYKEYWNGKTAKDGITAYFQSIIDNCSYYSSFQVYGHLDYLIRYLPNEKKEYSYKEYSEIIDVALKSIILHGKGIECNSSGLKYGLGFPHPRKEILKRYLELGGEIITIGSDAHKPEHIAFDFSQIHNLLLSLGFKYYTVYKEQKPEFIRL